MRWFGRFARVIRYRVRGKAGIDQVTVVPRATVSVAGWN
jgi:hypothetical protein